MAIKKEKLNFEKIVKTFGFPTNMIDFRKSYKQSTIESKEKIAEFEKKLLSLQSFKEIIEFIIANEDLIDIELYLLNIAVLLTRDYENEKTSNFLGTKFSGSVRTDEKNSKSKKNLLEIAKKMLKNIDVVTIDFQNDNIIIHSSQEFVGNKNYFEKKQADADVRLKQIEKEIGFQNAIKNFYPSDLSTFFTYPNLGNILAYNFLKSSLKTDEVDSVHDNLHNTDISTKDFSEDVKIFRWKEFFELIRNNIKYVDIDKMLLLSGAILYNKYGVDLYNFSLKETENLKEYINKIEELLKDKDITVTSNRFSKDISIENLKESVQTLNNHFINGRFYSEKEINLLSSDIISGKRSIQDFTEDELKNSIGLSREEILILLQNNPLEMKFLVEKNLISVQEFTNFVMMQNEIPQLELLEGYRLELIKNEDVLNYYLKGKTSLEDIEYLKQNIEQSDLDTIVSTEELVKLYLDTKKKDEFKKYRKLYKLLKIKNKDIQKQNEISEEILSISNELLDDNELSKLYEMGLITVDVFIGYSGENSLNSLLQNSKIKAKDIRRLYETQVITYSMFENILKNPAIEDGVKLALIYTTFSDKKYADLRNKLLDCLNDIELEENKGNVSKTKKSNRQNQTDGEKDNKDNIVKYITDPCIRWNFISSFDSDYIIKNFVDGYIVVYMPNQEKYLIEKFLDNKKDFAYGSATYILSEDMYEQEQNNIIENGKIRKSVLVELRKNNPSDRIKKIVHNGWEEALCKCFNLEDEQKYTDDEKKKIYALARECKEAKSVFSRD